METITLDKDQCATVTTGVLKVIAKIEIVTIAQSLQLEKLLLITAELQTVATKPVVKKEILMFGNVKENAIEILFIRQI